MMAEFENSDQDETLLAHLKGVSAILDQLAGQDPQAYARAVNKLRDLAKGTGDGSCGGRFLMMASTYLDYSAWIRSPLGAPADGPANGPANGEASG
jgi:hypothetical protein